MSAEARIDALDAEFREQRKTVSEQGQVMAVLASSISEIKNYMKESIELQKELAVLFEKFTNHEEQNSGEHKHLHLRVNSLENDLKEFKKNHKDTCDNVIPMAQKGASVHKGLMVVAWGLGSMVGVMLFAMVIRFIKTANYTP